MANRCVRSTAAYSAPMTVDSPEIVSTSRTWVNSFVARRSSSVELPATSGQARVIHGFKYDCLYAACGSAVK